MAMILSAAILVGAFLAAMMSVVLVHELGHWLAARAAGIRAETVSLGLGRPLLALRSRSGARWQLAAVPLGGYVAFRDSRRTPRLPGCFDTAPIPARAATIAAGPAANFVFATIVFAGAALWSGSPGEAPVIDRLHPLPVDHGLQPGDRVRAIGGAPVETLEDIRGAAGAIPPAPLVPWTVQRADAETVVPGPFPNAPLLRAIRPASPAQAAGLRAGDVITAVNGAPVHDFRALRDIVAASENQPLRLTVWREGRSWATEVVPQHTDIPSGGRFTARATIGVTVDLPFDAAREPVSLPGALARGAAEAAGVAVLTAATVRHALDGTISGCNLRGVAGVAEISAATAEQGPRNFLLFLASLSVVVGLMNLLPVPVLDGGQLIFLAWEAISGRQPHPRAAFAMMAAGVVALMALMTVGLINDLTC